jgi:hypothetical protein
MYPERYGDVYNKTSQNITDNTINANRRIKVIVLGSTELLTTQEKLNKITILNQFKSTLTL